MWRAIALALLLSAGAARGEAASTMGLDFDDDMVEGDVMRPDIERGPPEYARAWKRVRAGNFAGAWKALRDAVAKWQPKPWQRRALRNEAAWLSGMAGASVDEALRVIDALAQVEAKPGEARAQLAQAWADQGRYRDALVIVDAAGKPAELRELREGLEKTLSAVPWPVEKRLPSFEPRPASAPPPPPPPPLPPTMTLKRDVRAAVRVRMAEIRTCYERALNAKPTLAGRVTLRMVLRGSTATVTVGSATRGLEKVARCVVERARDWRLPATDGTIVTVTFPLALTSSGG